MQEEPALGNAKIAHTADNKAVIKKLVAAPEIAWLNMLSLSP